MTHAKSWAEARGLARVNPVHGKTVYRVPVDWSFSHRENEKVVTKASSSVELQAGPHCLL